MKTNNIRQWYIEQGNEADAEFVKRSCTFSGLYDYILAHDGEYFHNVYNYLGDADTPIREAVTAELFERYNLHGDGNWHLVK